MRRPRNEVLSVVEHGWRGARECSLALNTRAIPVTHVIKGWLDADLRAIIRPYPYVRLVSVPRLLFRLWLWWMLLEKTIQGRLRWVLVDHERTRYDIAWWCRRFGIVPVTIQEDEDGGRVRYALWVGDQRRSFAEIFEDGS